MTRIVARHYAEPDHRRRLWFGLLIATVATIFGLEQAGLWLDTRPAVARELEASLFASLATGFAVMTVIAAVF